MRKVMKAMVVGAMGWALTMGSALAQSPPKPPRPERPASLGPKPEAAPDTAAKKKKGRGSRLASKVKPKKKAKTFKKARPSKAAKKRGQGSQKNTRDGRKLQIGNSRVKHKPIPIKKAPVRDEY